MKDSMLFVVGTLGGRQKVKKYTRKLIMGLPGHKKLDPNEKRFKAYRKFKREEDDK